jgi:cephalosporin hydroxylase
MREIITPDWPVGQKKYELLMLQQLLKNERLERILEIGTWTGGTALLWAKIVSKYDNGIVYCCDFSFNYGTHYSIEPGVNIMREYRDQVYAHTIYAKHVKEIPGNSHDPAYIEQVKNIVGPLVDFIFIDGDHEYEGVKADFYNFYPFVKPGGHIAFHDILDTEYHRKYGCMVAQFWNEIKNNFEYWEFIDNNSYPGLPEIMPSKAMGIGVIKKPL